MSKDRVWTKNTKKIKIYRYPVVNDEIPVELTSDPAYTILGLQMCYISYYLNVVYFISE